MIISRTRFLYLINIFFINLYLLLCSTVTFGQELPRLRQKPYLGNRGVWITCFSEKRVLYSQRAISELINFCRQAQINEIYLQIYRAGKAYYDSRICQRSDYEEMVKVAGTDTIDLLLKEAIKNNIKVFAWINVLSLAANKKADILTKFGNTTLTKDQYLRPSMRTMRKNKYDKYYLRDKQLFLEPGDLRVRQYILAIVSEIITRYPSLSGIHLDYIRYPHPVPYLPSSKFNKYGLTYGYGEENVARFEKEKGLNPLTMKDEKDNYLLWDNWKRDQITVLVESISTLLRSGQKRLLFSCAVIPSPEKAYLIAFQDWSFWLEKGIVDYVVIMNYTRDNRLAKEIVKSALAHRGKGMVYIGMGAFLMKNEPELFFEQYKIISELAPDGIVFFSYDDIIITEPE
jgi:uncharacterized lipoprotein YddW (UPF0748 family)